MKKIYYRKSKTEYQTGFFISGKWIIGFLSLIGILSFLTLTSLGLPNWLHLTILIIVGIPTVYLFENEPKTHINIKTDFNGISLKAYVRKKVKKNKSKNSFVEIIGDYEYEMVVSNTDLLLDFYTKFQQELNTIYEEENDKVDSNKYQYLNYQLNKKIENLENIKNIELNI